MMERTKHILLDTLGFLLMLISPLFGWLPGPGGIPIFIAGLGLLAINHEWAKRWLKTIKEKGVNVIDAIFVKHPVWEAFYDIMTVIFVVVGVQLLNTYTKNITLTIGILLLLTAFVLFIGNRKRLKRFMNHVKNR
jgi:hypothetical protein